MRVSAKTWHAIGWIAIAMVAVSIPYLLVDGVMGLVVMCLAMVVGGSSGVGLNSTAGFGVGTMLACLVLTFGFVGINYVSSTGNRAPELTFMLNALLVLALPILIASCLLLIGTMRRRHAARQASERRHTA